MFHLANIIFSPLNTCLGSKKYPTIRIPTKLFKKNILGSRGARAFVEKLCSFTYGYFVFQGHQNTLPFYPLHTRKLFLWSFRGSTFFLPRLQETVIGLCHPSYYSQCIFVDTGNSICMYLNIVWWEYPWTNWQFLFLKTPMKKDVFTKHVLEILLLWYL